MALLTLESKRPRVISQLIRKAENRLYAHFETPSIENLFSMFDIFRHKKTDLDVTDVEGNRIKVIQLTYTHEITGLSRYQTKGVRVSIRQKLPEEKVHSEKYLSLIMSRDEKGDIDLATCVVEPTTTIEEKMEYGDYKRIGDLRIDYLSKKKGFKKGVVDGNDDGFGIPTGEWFLDGQSFDNAVTRGYLLLANRLFGVGEVPQLKKTAKPQISGLLEK